MLAYVDAKASNSKASSFNGPVEPGFPVDPPASVEANLNAFGGAFELRTRSNEPAEMNQEKDLLIGAYFGVRRQQFK